MKLARPSLTIHPALGLGMQAGGRPQAEVEGWQKGEICFWAYVVGVGLQAEVDGWQKG